MKIEEAKGFVVLTGLLIAGIFITFGIMEKRLKNVRKIIKQIEDDNIYTN